MRKLANGLKYIGVIAVLLVCVKQTFALASQSVSKADSINPASISLPADYCWWFKGAENGELMGESVSGIGDVNGDGFDDVIVGSPLYTGSVYREGVVFVFYGSLGGLTSTPSWTMGSGIKGTSFGISVSAAGDVNGDGYDDVIIGAPNFMVDFGDSGQPPSGAAFVYHGSSSGLSSIPDWEIYAEAPNIGLGQAVSSAGDVNGDGYADIIVGAPYYESEEFHSNEGKVYLYLGGPDGLSTTEAWTFECDSPTASCGASLGDAGDVNGDGYDDVIIGAPNLDEEYDQQGAAFLFLGNPTGLNITPDWSILGGKVDALLGSSVAGAGDVNGDGFDDVVVGAQGFTLEPIFYGGAAYIYHGSASGLNLDPNWVNYGSESGARFGSSVHGAGDVDQDGYADVLIGAYLLGVSGGVEPPPDAGAVYLYKGTPTGLNTLADWTGIGTKAEAWFGYSVCSAGDVNGDTMDDVIIGAPKYKVDDKTLAGAVFAYYAQTITINYSLFVPLILVQYAD